MRALVGVVEIYAFSGAPAFFSALVSARGKRLGDYAAGTYVVRDRVRLALAPPPAMPPHLAPGPRTPTWPRCRPGSALAVRQFLAGASRSTRPPARASARRLAAAVSEYVAPPPPPGTPPEAFLAAVLAARRERDAARLARQAEARRRLLSPR